MLTLCFVCSGELREFLIKEKLSQSGVIDLTEDSDDEDVKPVASTSTSTSSTPRKRKAVEIVPPSSSSSKRTRGKRVDYTIKTDEEFFEEAEKPSANHGQHTEKELAAIGKAHAMKTARTFWCFQSALGQVLVLKNVHLRIRRQPAGSTELLRPASESRQPSLPLQLAHRPPHECSRRRREFVSCEREDVIAGAIAGSAV